MRSKSSPSNSKFSVGVACARWGEKENSSLEVLLVKKRYTYSFAKFVLGEYKIGDFGHIKQLLARTTVEEKIIIKSLNFSYIWYTLWSSFAATKNYRSARSKFESSFNGEGSEKLLKIIGDTPSTDNFWELPKGRKRGKKESDLHCAVREFEEETGVDKTTFTIFPYAHSTVSHKSDGVTYISKYYFAFADEKTEPRIKVELSGQSVEVSSVKWVPANELQYYNLSKHSKLVVRKLLNYMRSRRKTLKVNYNPIKSPLPHDNILPRSLPSSPTNEDKKIKHTQSAQNWRELTKTQIWKRQGDDSRAWSRMVKQSLRSPSYPHVGALTMSRHGKSDSQYSMARKRHIKYRQPVLPVGAQVNKASVQSTS